MTRLPQTPPRPPVLTGAVVAALLVFGFPAMAGDDGPAAPAAPKATTAKEAPAPAWLVTARARMKETGQDGVALIVPDDATSRKRLVRELSALLESPTDGVREALLCGVVVLVPRTAVAAKDGHDAVLLRSTDGACVASGTVSLRDAESFARDVRSLVSTGERLASRVKAARTEDVVADIERVAGCTEAQVEAQHRLIDGFDACGVAVLEAARIAPTEAGRDALRAVVTAAFTRRIGTARYGGTVTDLPFGAS